MTLNNVAHKNSILRHARYTHVAYLLEEVWDMIEGWFAKMDRKQYCNEKNHNRINARSWHNQPYITSEKGK